MQQVYKNSQGTVAFKSVGLRYGQGPEVLRDINFQLSPGSFYFLTGASGAGKTSLLSLMYLAQKPTRGQVLVFGENTNIASRTELSSMRRKIGVVFQDFRLLSHLSAFENVALPLRISGIPETSIKRHVTELLTWVGLGEALNSKPQALSGGQQQRVAIARAIINRPALLLADEPTGNVDDRIATRLLHLFIELNKRGTTVVIATHNKNMIRQFSFPRLHLTEGKLSIIDDKSVFFSPEADGL